MPAQRKAKLDVHIRHQLHSQLSCMHLIFAVAINRLPS